LYFRKIVAEELKTRIAGFVDMGSESVAPMVEPSNNRLEIHKLFFVNTIYITCFGEAF